MALVTAPITGVFDSNTGALVGIDGAGPGGPTAQLAALTSAISSTGNVYAPGLSGILVAGDSLGARQWNELSPATNITQTAGLASVTITGLFPVVGNRIKIGNVTSDPRWNGFWIVTAASGSTAQFPVDPSFDPAPTTTRSQITVSVATQRLANGDYNWAEMLNGVDYGFIDNVAVGSRTLPQIAADYPMFEAKYSNCLIDLCGGTNDPKNSVALSDSVAALASYIQQAQNNGHRVLLNTVPFLGSSVNTLAIRNATLALNQQIKLLAVKYGMPWYDRFAALADPAAANSLAAYIDSSDGIHPNPTGVAIMGAAKASIYAKFVQSRPIDLRSTIADTVGVTSGSLNIIDGFLAGTGGTGGAGSVATGWVLAPSTLTVTGSKGVGAVGATQIFTLSGTSGSFVFTGADLSANAFAGGTYQFVMKMSYANFAAGLRMTMAVNMTGGGYTLGQIRVLNTLSATSTMPTANQTGLVLKSEPFIMPASTSNLKAQLSVVTTANPGGTETITLEDLSLQRIA